MFELIVVSSVMLMTSGALHVTVPTVIAIELLFCEPHEFETRTK